MGASKHICPNCGRKMKQQFIGLFHCKCGTSWRRDIVSASYCTTRLRFEVKDSTAVNEKAVKAAGAAGVIRPDKTTCQVIIGTKVQFVYDELKKML
jgi:phosphotransferase system IIB component